MGQRVSDPIAINHVVSVTKTSTSNSGSLKNLGTAVPHTHCSSFILDVTAASGTSPTLDISFQTSPDGGTTYYTVFRFAQVTAASTRHMIIRPFLGSTEVAAEEAITSTGTGVLKINQPFLSGVFDHRFLYTVAGTNPSFTFTIWGIHQSMEIGT